MNADVKETTELSELLQEYIDIFEEPTSLPPHRANHDHKIPLMEGSNPVNQRPYHYALYQNTEIDKMVQNKMQELYKTVQVRMHLRWYWLRKKTTHGDCALTTGTSTA